MIRLILLLSLLILPALKAGEPVFRDDFTTYTEGETPLFPPDGNTFPWRFDEGWSATVASEDEDRYLKIERPAGLPYGTFGRGFEPKLPCERISFQMALRLPSNTDPSDYFIILGHYETSPHSGPVKVRLSDRHLSVYHGEEGAHKSMPFALDANTWYLMTIEVDFESQHYQLTLRRESDSNELFSSGELPFVMASPLCNTLLIRSTESAAPTRGALAWDIARVRIETAP